MDNCPAYGKPKLDNITLVFMPPNTTSKLQPCDQEIIANFKHQYRSLVMRRLLVEFESHTSIPNGQFSFGLTLLDAMYIARTAWGCVTDTTIANCFYHSGFTNNAQRTETVSNTTASDGPDIHDNDTDLHTDLQSVFSQVQELLPQCKDVTVADYISVDSNLETSCEVFL